MSSTFFGINIARSGLAAQKQALDVLGHNIANASDTTYRRQRVVMSESAVMAQSQQASQISSSSIGTGVTSDYIERVYDSLIEGRLGEATTNSSYWNYFTSTLSEIEAIIGEPSDTGLQSALDNFWSSWEDVATNPDDIALRSTLLESTEVLCQKIQHKYSAMQNISFDLNIAAGDTINNINRIANRIANLNEQIGTFKPGQLSVNALEDERDALLSELSQLTNVSKYGENTQNYTISIGGHVLVQGSTANKLQIGKDADGNNEIQWANDNSPAIIKGGKLGAITDLKDNTIPSYLQKLDTIASTLVTTINSMHNSGYTLDGTAGGDFFQAGSTAVNIWLDSSIINHPESIAASGSSNPNDTGDNTIAKNISALRDTAVSFNLTINNMYQALVTNIGNDSVSAKNHSITSSLMVAQLTTEQQSISGVSIDEEMVNMIKFQQAYNAAARVLTAMDEMLEVLVNRTGNVGR